MATITFYPEISGTGQVLTDLALALAEQGIKVKVYTAQPHYYEKHDALPAKENYRGIEIVRLSSTTFNKNFRFARILNWASFTFFAFLALLFDASPFPILLVSSPPTLPFIGWFLRKLKRKRFVFLMHDVYPDIGVKLGFFKENGPTVRLWNFFNRKTYQNCSRVIVLSEDMGKIVKEHFAPAGRDGKIEVIHNWADERIFHPIPKEKNLFLKQNPLPFDFLVQYSGNIGFDHELEPLIEAARELQDLKIGFLFIGEGGKKEKLKRLAAQYGLSNVRFFPFQPQNIFLHSLCASDLSVVALEPGLEGLAVPSKFYPILASGRPILALMRENCDIATLIKQYRCGFVIPDGNTASVATVLRNCYGNREETSEFGRNARRCFEENFTRASSVQRYQAVLNDLMKETSDPRN